MHLQKTETKTKYLLEHGKIVSRSLDFHRKSVALTNRNVIRIVSFCAVHKLTKQQIM